MARESKSKAGRSQAGRRRATSKAVKRKSNQQAKLCGANLTKRGDGSTCSRPAGWGTDHVGYGACKLHAGSTPDAGKGARKEMAKEAAIMYGLPVMVDPHTALLNELHRTAGHVAWLGQQVKELEEDNLTGPVGSEGEAAEGTYHHPKAEAHIYVRLYQEERKHLKDVAATCIKAGIEERRVRIAEQQGQLLAGVILGVLQALGIDPATPKVRKVIREQLTAASGPDSAFVDSSATEKSAA